MNISRPCHAAGDLLRARSRPAVSPSNCPTRVDFKPNIGPNEFPIRRPLLEDGARSVGPDHLVVSHVDDKQVRLMGGEVAGDLQRHVRIDRRHRRIDHLELHVRVALAQQDFENPPDAERRVGYALRRGTSENKDADSAGGFGRKQARDRRTGERAREEPPAKLRVAPVNSVGIGADEERSSDNRSLPAATRLPTREEEHRRNDRNRQAK